MDSLVHLLVIVHIGYGPVPRLEGGGGVEVPVYVVHPPRPVVISCEDRHTHHLPRHSVLKGRRGVLGPVVYVEPIGEIILRKFSM